jgi:hypothetical protein
MHRLHCILPHALTFVVHDAEVLLCESSPPRFAAFRTQRTAPALHLSPHPHHSRT